MSDSAAVSQLIQDVSQKCNLPPDKVRGALGVLMAFLLDSLETRTERKVMEAHPEVCLLAKGHRSGPGGGGFLGFMLGSKARLLALPGKLSEVGVDYRTLKPAVSLVMDWLEERTSPELWREVAAQIPRL